MISIEAQSADDAWCQAMEKICNGNDVITQKSRLGLTRELLHVNFTINNPRERWVLSRTPAINPAFAIAEVFWILYGSNETKFLNFWNPILPKFIGNEKSAHGAYGFRIRKQFGIDQLERAFKILSRNPDSRQVVIQIWNPELDLPGEDGSAPSLDIPCNICSMPKIRYGKLEWLQIMRSNDLFRGTPYNIVQFTMLQEILAGWLGVEIGSYHQISDSLHIYESDWQQIGIIPYQTNITNTDQIGVKKEQFDLMLENIFKAMQRLSADDLNEDTFYDICNLPNILESYKNMLLITAADSARRRGWNNQMNWASSQCTNPLLSLAWKAWHDRIAKSKKLESLQNAIT